MSSNEDLKLSTSLEPVINSELNSSSNSFFDDVKWNQSGWKESLDIANNTEDEYVPYRDRPETYIVPVLFFTIFVIGVLGNGTLIAIFIRHRTMRSIPNLYICSLAVGDILVIIFCVPFTSTVYTVESWPYGLVVCKFSEFIKDVSIGVSVFTLTALSADRYFAIKDPMRKLQGKRATRMTAIVIAGIWLGAVLFALPAIIYSYIRVIEIDENKSFKVCYPFPPELGDIYPKANVMFKFLAYYAIPLLFISSFYVMMAYHLMKSTRNIPGESQGQTKQAQSRKKVAKMVLVFVFLFALCFFPHHVFFLWFYYHPSAEEDYNEFWNQVRIVGFCLSFINSCLNPITLYCVSGTFRKYYNRYLFCCLCGRQQKEERLRQRLGLTNSRGIAASTKLLSMAHTDATMLGGNGRTGQGGAPTTGKPRSSNNNLRHSFDIERCELMNMPSLNTKGWHNKKLSCGAGGGRSGRKSHSRRVLCEEDEEIDVNDSTIALEREKSSSSSASSPKDEKVVEKFQMKSTTISNHSHANDPFFSNPKIQQETSVQIISSPL